MSLSEIVVREMRGIIDLSSFQLAALERHYALLVQWNRRMNLTTVIDLPEAATRHYCESLFLASRLDAGTVADVGSGPGFPGIPLAIARPDCRVDLVESHQRKCVFLREAARGLLNAGIRASRAEALPYGYDWLVSRAVEPEGLMRLRIARRYAILLGGEDASHLNADEIVAVPWGQRRVLALGSFGGG